ncbi:MAG: addiction module protein [Pirellulales bacterium]
MQLPLSTMTTAEKLDAMEQLWTSLQADPGAIPTPDWNGEVLEERRLRQARGETTFSSLEDVRKRLG